MVERRTERTGGDSSRDDTGSPDGNEPRKVDDDALGVPDGNAADGPKGGWSALRSRAWPRVHGIASQFGMDEHVAEEVLQEALMRLLVAYGAGEAVKDPVAWVRRTAKRLLIDIWRGRRTLVGPARSTPMSALPDGLDEPADETAGPVDLLILRDLRERAPALLARLPPPCREVAILEFVYGWTRPELRQWLKETMSISESSCQRILTRTHEMLRFIASGGDPRTRWPSRFSERESNFD